MLALILTSQVAICAYVAGWVVLQTRSNTVAESVHPRDYPAVPLLPWL